MASIFSALSPIPQLRIAPTPTNTPDASVSLPQSFKSSAITREPVFTSPTANTSSSSISGKSAKKPLGPRQRQDSSPSASLNRKKVEKALRESMDAEKPTPVLEKDASAKSPVTVRNKENAADKEKRRRSRVFGVDLTSLSRNGNAQSESPVKEKENKRKSAVLAPSSQGITKRKVTAEKEKARDKENAHGSVSRRATTTKYANKSSLISTTNTISTTPASSKPSLTTATTALSTTPNTSFLSTGSLSPEQKQDSVRDRMREWERERGRFEAL